MKMRKKQKDSNVVEEVKVKKPFYKRWWFIALVVFVVIGVFSEDETENGDIVEEDTELVEPEVVEEVEAEEEPEPVEVVEEPVEVEEEPEPIEEAAEEEPESVEVVFDPNDYNAELTYDDLARNPVEHSFKAVTFEGKIIQVMQGTDSSQFRIATNDDYDKVMLIEIDNTMLETRILDNDYIRFYGTYIGEISYESTLGGTITIPGVLVNHFEFK